MSYPPRSLAFILAPTDQGTLIVNRFDYQGQPEGAGIGVGFQLLSRGTYEAQEADFVRNLLGLRRQCHGDGVVVVDCGANIGVFTVEWAKSMTGWGQVVAIKAQERIFYALAGNIAINNCLNARAIHAAAGASTGTMKIPQPNYLMPATFGSLELRARESTEFIGQEVSYAEEHMAPVSMITIDSVGFGRLDLLKIDVEGMETDVLEGAKASIERTRPILLIEHIKTDVPKLVAILTGHGYNHYVIGMNVLAIHTEDPVMKFVSVTP